METVGFVGVGKIGLPISENLIKSGYRVLGVDHARAWDFQIEAERHDRLAFDVHVSPRRAFRRDHCSALDENRI